MSATNPPTLALYFDDKPIRTKSEMISLTDMWRACADPSRKKPSDWLCLAGT